MYLQHFSVQCISNSFSMCIHVTSTHNTIIVVSYTTWLSEDSNIYSETSIVDTLCTEKSAPNRVLHFWDQNAHNRHVWDSTSCRDYSGVLISGGSYIEQFHFIYRN